MMGVYCKTDSGLSLTFFCGINWHNWLPMAQKLKDSIRLKNIKDIFNPCELQAPSPKKKVS